MNSTVHHISLSGLTRLFPLLLLLLFVESLNNNHNNHSVEIISFSLFPYKQCCGNVKVTQEFET